MTTPDNLTFRPITVPGELGLFHQFPYELNHEIDGDLRDGHRQPGWLWVALRDGRLAGRAGWWARPGSAVPHALDIFDLGNVPMARSFHRTGWVTTGHQIDMKWRQ